VQDNNLAQILVLKDSRVRGTSHQYLNIEILISLNEESKHY
jgi:hypothetical protein